MYADELNIALIENIKNIVLLQNSLTNMNQSFAMDINFNEIGRDYLSIKNYKDAIKCKRYFGWNYDD